MVVCVILSHWCLGWVRRADLRALSRFKALGCSAHLSQLLNPYHSAHDAAVRSLISMISFSAHDLIVSEEHVDVLSKWNRSTR